MLTGITDSSRSLGVRRDSSLHLMFHTFQNNSVKQLQLVLSFLF